MSALVCDHWVLGERGRERCGQPASHARNGRGGRFLYCELHARVADDAMKGKSGITKIPEEMQNAECRMKKGETTERPAEAASPTVSLSALAALRESLKP